MVLFVAIMIEFSPPSLDFSLHLVQISILALMTLDFKITFFSTSLQTSGSSVYILFAFLPMIFDID